MGDYKKEIRAYALKNALEFGEAAPAKILPKLFQHGLQKREINAIIPTIEEIVAKVNKEDLKTRKMEFGRYKKYIKERVEKEKTLAELPKAGKGMVFRLAPYPSGALHIGNAKTYLLNALYAEKYGGKRILVMDDTIGSEAKQITKESYDLIKSGLSWLGIKFGKKIIYKSDRLKTHYKYAEELIDTGKAYVCGCSQAEFKKYKDAEKECPHRSRNIDENLEAWKAMFDKKTKPGSAVLRIKTSMKNPNPAFRDRVLFRISDRKHPRVGNKYKVWPSLEMSWAIDDHLLGISHIIRGNDLVMETEMEKFIWNIFGWKEPEIIHTGLVKIKGLGAKVSKSKAQEEVRSGEFSGWDDPRTWSIQSLRRRGFDPAALRKFVFDIGLNRHNIIVPIDSLYAVNRKTIDEKAHRYSFIESPIELEIAEKPNITTIKIPVHPEKRQTRNLKISSILISKDDKKKFAGKEIRLINLYNIKLDKKKNKATFTTVENKNIRKINWISDFVEARVLLPDGKWVEGYADSGVKKLKKGSVIQFERWGFVRFDGQNKGKYEFWFAHK